MQFALVTMTSARPSISWAEDIQIETELQIGNRTHRSSLPLTVQGTARLVDRGLCGLDRVTPSALHSGGKETSKSWGMTQEAAWVVFDVRGGPSPSLMVSTADMACPPAHSLSAALGQSTEGPCL